MQGNTRKCSPTDSSTTSNGLDHGDTIGRTIPRSGTTQGRHIHHGRTNYRPYPMGAFMSHREFFSRAGMGRMMLDVIRQYRRTHKGHIRRPDAIHQGRGRIQDGPVGGYQGTAQEPVQSNGQGITASTAQQSMMIAQSTPATRGTGMDP